jgi:hypothetical protein
MHHIAVQCWRRAVLGEQRDRPALSAVLVERLDPPAPGHSPSVVELAQVQHMALHRLAAGYATVFHAAPVAMLIAFFSANLAPQKHDGWPPKSEHDRFRLTR